MKNTFDILRDVVAIVRCKPGWTFGFSDDEGGFRLVIIVPGEDSRGGNMRRIAHYFPIPLTTWNQRSWTRWLFECCRRIEDHELGEWFMIGDWRPFSPLHGPGEDPYTIRETATEHEARTNQVGELEPLEHLQSRPKP